MTAVVDWLSTPWIGTVFAIVSLALAIYFYRKSKSVSRLAYLVDEISVVGGASAQFPKDLEITFGGTAVPRVTAGRVMLWNSGTTTIKGDQIVASDPLRFEVPEGCEILRGTIVKFTRRANAVVLKLADNAITIEFDYLDPDDGVAIGIYHSADRGKIGCYGTLRGLSGGPVSLGQSNEQVFRRLSRALPFNVPVKTFGIAGLLVGMGMVVFGIFYDTLKANNPSWNEEFIPLPWFLIGVGILYTVTPMTLLWRLRRRHPKLLAHSIPGEKSNDAEVESAPLD